MNTIALFKITAVEEKTAKPQVGATVGEKYMSISLMEDNTEEEQRLSKIYGRVVRKTSGGRIAVYAAYDRDDLHSLAKEFLAAAEDNKPIILVEGMRAEMETDRPFELINPTTSKPAVDAEGKPRLGNSISFFCPTGVSSKEVFRRIQRNLKFVEVVNVPAAPDGTDPL